MDVRYTLTTSDGCGGSGLIGKPDSFTWGHGTEGEGETVSALFEQIEDDGTTVSDAFEIEGDDWRALEDSGELDKVLTWVRRGCVLESAVDAAIQEVDPEGFDGTYEDRIDDLIAERDELRAMLAAVLPFAESRVEDIEESEAAEGFTPDAETGRVSQRARDLIERARHLAGDDEPPPPAYATPFYVVIDDEQSAAECATLDEARAKGRELADAERLPCSFSIQDANGAHVEDIARSDGRTLPELMQAFSAAHRK